METGDSEEEDDALESIEEVARALKWKPGWQEQVLREQTPDLSLMPRVQTMSERVMQGRPHSKRVVNAIRFQRTSGLQQVLHNRGILVPVFLPAARHILPPQFGWSCAGAILIQENGCSALGSFAGNEEGKRVLGVTCTQAIYSRL